MTSGSSEHDRLQGFFAPRGVAIVGVSEREGNLGQRVVDNLLDWGYPGTIAPVGRSGGSVRGVRILKRVDDLPDGIDLACVLTPADTVETAVAALGERGVRSTCIESSGFAELGESGQVRANRVLAMARVHGMRLIGPNGLGVINTSARLCVPFARIRPLRAGPVSLLCQSGGVMFHYLHSLEEEGLGLASAVSFGNKIDVDEVDLLEHLAHDDSTQVVCMYLEDIRRGRSFLEAAARLGKPVVLHKANRSERIQATAASHTAALFNDHAVVTAAARQAGVVPVDSPRQAMVAVKGLLMPPLRGPRVAVISRSGGHAVIAADSCARHGLELPPLPDAALDPLRSQVRAGVIRLRNPLDLGDLWDLGAYVDVLRRVASLATIDGIVYIFVSVSPVDPEAPARMAKAVAEVVRESGKPIAYCFESWHDIAGAAKSLARVPVFSGVDDAVEALAVSHACSVRAGRAPPLAADRQVADVQARGGEDRRPLSPLPMEECLALLASRGLRVLPTRIAVDADGAVEAARELGFPVAAKLLSAAVIHKSEAGAVRVGLRSPRALRSACREMLAAAGDRPVEGFAVQPVAPDGVELIVGFRRDPAFGPVIVVGHGGTLVEVIRDVSLRVAPVDPAEADEMLSGLSGSRVLAGARGRPAVDRDAIARFVASFSWLAIEHPMVEQLEVNPLIATAEGCQAVDVRGFALASGRRAGRA